MRRKRCCSCRISSGTIMNFSTFVDEWLQDIFIHLDFGKQCSLRRTSRRWMRLLTGNFVLRSIILDVPSNQVFDELHNPQYLELLPDSVPYKILRKCLSRIQSSVTPHPSHLIITRDLRRYPSGLVDYKGTILHEDVSTYAYRFIKLFCTHAVDIEEARRMQIVFNNLYPCSIWDFGQYAMVFGILQFQNIHFDARNICHEISLYIRPMRKTVKLVDWNPAVIGPYVIDCAAFYGSVQNPTIIVLQQLRNAGLGGMLSEEQMNEVNEVMSRACAKHGTEVVREKIELVLKGFQPDFKLPKSSADFTGVNLDGVCPFVCRILLYAYTDD